MVQPIYSTGFPAKYQTAMPRFYLPHPPAPGTRFDLPDTVARHIQVLRLQPGDTVELFDGQGMLYPAVICAMGKKSVQVQLQAAAAHSVESPLPITLLQSVSASERMDLTIQKSVELGVSHIVPVLSERSSQRLSGERAAKKVARWQEIAIAACEQCGRTQLPRVADIALLPAALSALPATGARLLMSLQPGASLKQLPPPLAVQVLVGPEGGFSLAEEQLAITQFGFQAIGLGPRVLRTETAALAAVAAMQTLWGDFSA